MRRVLSFPSAAAPALPSNTKDQEPIMDDPKPPLLNEHERELLRLIALGRSRAEIGRAQFKSRATIRNHELPLMRKCGAAGRDRLISLAATWRALGLL